MSRRGGMLEWVLLLAAGLCFTLGFAGRGGRVEVDPAQRAPASLRVVTWNVGHELDEGAPALRMEDEAAVVATLRALDPDLVVLQEVADVEQAERLASALGEGWQRAASSVGAGRHVVILARAASVRRARLRGVGGRAVAAAVTLARPGLPASGLVVAGVHASAFSAGERNGLLGDVRQQLDALAGDHPRILAGDLNIDLDPNARRDLLSGDAYLDVQTYNAVLGATDSHAGLFDAAAHAGPTAEPDRRLDYLLVDPGLAVEQAGPVRGHRAPGMDHDPVLADLRVTR